MTLLQRSDGDDAASGVSYLELAELFIRSGSQTDKDLEYEFGLGIFESRTTTRQVLERFFLPRKITL